MSGILAWGPVGFGIALVFWRLLEQSARWRWTGIAIRSTRAVAYRSGEPVATHVDGAPALVVLTALACLGFGFVFAPILVFVLLTLPFDGVALPLGPGAIAAVATAWCGVIMLRRSAAASTKLRVAAVCSLLLDVPSLGLIVVHSATVGHDEPSASLTMTALVFAVAGIAQAALILLTLRSHRALFDAAQPACAGRAASEA